MPRLLAESVEVWRRDGDPDQFRWRGRLYLVREVLARWTEAGQWWRARAAASLLAGAAGVAVLDDGERDWWRLEAGVRAARQGGSAGTTSSGATGIYDLCLDGATGTWTLARVLD